MNRGNKEHSNNKLYEEQTQFITVVDLQNGEGNQFFLWTSRLLWVYKCKRYAKKKGQTKIQYSLCGLHKFMHELLVESWNFDLPTVELTVKLSLAIFFFFGFFKK